MKEKKRVATFRDQKTFCLGLANKLAHTARSSVGRVESRKLG
jgi:hypothetical protein